MKSQFEPLQPLISFVSDTPRLAWVAKGYQLGHLIYSDNRWELAVSHDKQEAEENLFSWVSIKKVKPFTPELWAKCQEWIIRRQQLGIDYERLKRGKQTVETTEKSIVPLQGKPWQASLLVAA